MATPLNISLKVTGLDQVKNDLTSMATVGKRSFEELRASAASASTAATETERGLTNLGRRARTLVSEFDPAAASALRVSKALADITAAERLGLVTAQQLATVTAGLRREHEALARSSAQVVTSTGQVTYGMRQLGLQLGDIGTSLASGGSPLRVLAQQADQVRVAVGQAGGLNAVMAATGTAIGRLVTPSNLAAAGLVALGAGAAAVFTHAAKLETQAKSFTVSLEAMGTAALANGADFQKMVRDLQAIGVAADDARASLLGVARTPGVNPAAAGRIVATGANIAATLGGDVLQRSKEYAEAIGGGLEKTIQFGIAVRALDAVQAEQLRRMGDVTAAAKLIDDTYANRLNKTLGITARTLADVKSAFGSMWDSMVMTGPAQAGLKALEHTADVIKAIAEGKALFLNLPGMGQIALNDAAAQARLSAQTGAPINPGGASLPGATNTFDSRGLALNTAELERLSTVMAAAVQHLPTGYALLATSTVGDRPGTPGSLHPGGNALDVQLVGPNGPIANKGADTTGMYERLAAAAYLENQRLFPGTPLAWGGRFGVTPGSTIADLMHFDAGADRGTLRPPLPQIAARYQPQSMSASAADATFATVASAAQVTAGYNPDLLDEANKVAALQQKLLEATKMQDPRSRTWWTEYWQAIGAGTPTVEQTWAAMTKANQAEEVWRVSIEKGAAAERLKADGALATGQAYLQGVVPGLQASAAAQANLNVLNGTAENAAKNRGEILRGLAAEEVSAAAQATAGLRQQTEQAELLGAATQKGAGFEHDAALAVQASTATRSLLDKAQAAGIKTSEGVVAAINAETVALTKRNDAAKNAAELGRTANQNRDTLAVVQLETSLTGQTSEYIAAQVLHLQAVQELERRREPLTSDVAQNYLRSVDALSQARIHAAEVSRETARWDDAIRSVAETIDQSLVRTMEDLFSGKRVTDWGTQLKTMLTSLGSQLINGLLIRPALGQPLGLAPWGNFGEPQ